jgi:hypothetical protein
MGTLGSLYMALLDIRRRLLQHPVFVRGRGVSVDDPAYPTEIRDLDRLSERLALILRELRNQGHLLRAREQNLWNVPRDRRWVAASSIRQQNTELAKVLELASEIQRLLEDLIRKSGLIGQGDAAANIGELIGKLYQQSHSSALVGDQGGHGPVYLPYQAGQFQASPEAATILVFIALRAFTYLFKRARGANTGMPR